MATNTGKEFMEKTRYHYLETTDQMKGKAQPLLELPHEKGQRVVVLPFPDSWNVEPLTITDTIRNRESLRDFTTTPLELEELSYLLWSTQGVRKLITDTATFRTVPSAGARHAFETYLLVNNVSGLEKGLYRFLALDHRLETFWMEDDVADVVVRGCLDQSMVKTSAVTFIWTAVPHRMTWRYGQRGYRYLHLDAGHVCENLYLAAQAIQCGTCAIAAFDDDILNDMLDIDGTNQFVIYVAVTGKIV